MRSSEDGQVRAFEAGRGAALAAVLAVLDDLPATNPALAPEIAVPWNAALDAVRAHLGLLQAGPDAEGEGEGPAPRA